jgi:hypothetical protein
LPERVLAEKLIVCNHPKHASIYEAHAAHMPSQACFVVNFSPAIFESRPCTSLFALPARPNERSPTAVSKETDEDFPQLGCSQQANTQINRREICSLNQQSM